MTRLRWPPILERAGEIVEAHDTMMTLRQVHYRIVVEGLVPNTLNAYNRLGRLSAQWRREDRFPRLLDRGRRIQRPFGWDGPDDAHDWLKRNYRVRDRTEGQPWSLYVAAEKATLLAQLDAWFADRGIPVLTLGGYSGQELVTDVRDDITVSKRPSALLIATDLDPSGEDIHRDFADRVGVFDKVVRVALTFDQVERYELPPQVGKARDPRAADFVARHGELVQVELEALDPNDLRGLYEAALADYWDDDAYRVVLAREATERDQL